jgi:hypothetical protein
MGAGQRNARDSGTSGGWSADGPPSRAKSDSSGQRDARCSRRVAFRAERSDQHRRACRPSGPTGAPCSRHRVASPRTTRRHSPPACRTAPMTGATSSDERVASLLASGDTVAPACRAIARSQATGTADGSDTNDSICRPVVARRRRGPCSLSLACVHRGDNREQACRNAATCGATRTSSGPLRRAHGATCRAAATQVVAWTVLPLQLRAHLRPQLR